MFHIQDYLDHTIKITDLKFLEHNSSDYIYVPNINGLFEIDANVKRILESKGLNITYIYNSLPNKIGEEEYFSLIENLRENNLISYLNNNLTEVSREELQVETIKNISALTLMMVQECNLKCTYCYAGDGEYNEKGKMSFQTAKNAVDFLMRESGENEEVTLIFFGGEPLLNFKTIEEVVIYANEQAKLYDKAIKYSMTCNGTLLTKKITDFIVKHNIAVQVSVDGNKEAHDYNRFYGNKSGSYENIINKTESLRNQKRLGVRSTITPTNTDYVNIYKHLFSLNFRSVYASPAITMFTHEEFIGLIRKFKDLTAYFLELIEVKEYRKAQKISNVMKHLQRIHVGYESTYSCGAEVNFFAVDINGDLYPCHRFVNNKEYKQGNVYFELNEKKKKEFLIEAHTLNRDNCKNCWARNLCGGGCHHENYEVSGRIESPPLQYCMLTKMQLEEIIKLYLTLTEKEKEIIFN